VGVLGYGLLLQGGPGFYWLAWAYGQLLALALAVVVTTLLTLPMMAAAFALLAVGSINRSRRYRLRQGAKQLLRLLLAALMIILGLLPSLIWQFETPAQLAIAPWQVTYRALYVAPLDDNYGDLMLVQCHWLGWCHQVYRRYTNVKSAEDAYLAFDATTNQVGLHLEGRWVYVRTPGYPPCQEQLRASDPFGKCSFPRKD
jgi:hypothetical protein